MKNLILFTMSFFSTLGFAQNTYESVVIGRYPPPWTSLYNAVTESEALLEKIESGLEEVARREQEVLNSKAALGQHGYNAHTFFEEIVRLVESGEAVDLRRELIQTGAEATHAFFQQHENMSRDSFDLIMALTFHHLRTVVGEKQWNARDFATIKKKWLAMDKERLSYAANRDQFKKSKDTYRTTPFKAFFIKAKDLSDFIQSRGTVSDRIQYRLDQFLKMINLLKLAPVAAPGLYKLIQTIFKRLQPTADQNPLMSTVNKTLTQVVQKTGRTFEIEGLDLLPPKIPPAGEINLYLASHRDAMMDQAAMAAMGLDHVTPFAAVNNFVPEILNKFFGFKIRVIRHLNANHGFIVVGKGADPKAIPKMIQVLIESGVRNFMIYPEGRLPEGLGATAGVRDDFFSEKGVVHAAESLGFKVNLVVTSLIDNAGLFDGPSMTTESKYRVKIHGVIRDQIRREFMKHGGELGLGMLLEYGLIEALVTNERLMFGQVRPSQMKKMVLEEYVLGGNSCRARVSR